MEDSSSGPLWAVILVGMLSGVIGAVVGPILQRTFSRNDRALLARQVWAKEKLLNVFGVGGPVYASDGPQPVFRGLVPPWPRMAHDYYMHWINPALMESTDLMMLQPRRSSWARKWLYDWHFRLQPEARLIHTWWHYIEQRFTWDAGTLTDRETGETSPAGQTGTPVDARYAAANRNLEAAEAAYIRRVRRVQSSLAIWATGQWITHPSWAHPVFSWSLTQRLWPKTRAQRTAPKGLLDRSIWVKCDCVAKGDAAWAEVMAAEEKWRRENPGEGAGANSSP